MKITAEDVAQFIDDVVEAHQLNGVQTWTPVFREHIALVRSLEQIRAAAEDCEWPDASNVDMPLRRARLRSALAAYDRIAQGEGT